MDIFKRSQCHRVFHVWLLSIACQTSYLFAQGENFYEREDAAYPSPDVMWSQPDSFQDNAFNRSYSNLNSDFDPSPAYYPSYSQPYDDSSRDSSYSAETSQNNQNPPPEQNQWPVHSTSSQELSNFITFDPPSSIPSSLNQDQKNSRSSEQENSEKEEIVEAKKNEPTISHPSLISEKEEKEKEEKEKEEEEKDDDDDVPNLSQGKSNVKIFNRTTESSSRSNNAKEPSESVIGKKIVADSSVGLIEYSDKLKNKSETLPGDFPLNNNTASKSTRKIVSSAKPAFPILPSLAEPIAQTNAADRTLLTSPSPSGTNPATPLLPTAPIPPSLPTTSPLASPRAPTIITPTSPAPENSPANTVAAGSRTIKEISISFNNVAMIEYIRFISRISNKNFIFDDEDLQFNVTIVSQEPTTIENLMAALLQELKIRDLSLIEQGNNIIIHRNPRVRAPARIVADGIEPSSTHDSELVTRVFRLNTLDPIKASEIIRPLLSEDALVEVLRDTNNLILTDLVTNVNKIAQLIGTLDAPNSGVTIGQYVVRNAFVDSLVDLATKILQPIAQGNPFVLVPHSVSNSIFVVSNSFIVEKALAILQNLDMNEGRTKILSLETLLPSYPSQEEGGGYAPGGTGGPGQGPYGTRGPGGIGGIGGIGGAGQGPYGTRGPGGIGGAGAGGNYSGGPGGPGGPGGAFNNPEGAAESFPFGEVGNEGRNAPFSGPGQGQAPGQGFFAPGGIGSEGRPSAIFDESRDFMPGGIGANSRWSRELPLGHIERTLFFIYKLRYRKGDQIEIALRKIANSLQLMGTANADLISAINSSQWIESSNALIFTGTSIALEKVRELILEVDVPLRQVFIEMLILDTTVTDSLNYGVDWISRFGGGSTTGEEGFIGVANPNFISAAEGVIPATAAGVAAVLPVAQGFLSTGFTAGVIGTHLTHDGMRFNTIGGLVRAVHTDEKVHILLNPKIITEDNNAAEIFVGGVDRYKTQSITNDLGSLVTNNFQFIDVGTTLRVTPLIGNNGIITLEILQETTEAAAPANTTSPNQLTVDVNLVRVLSKTRTTTKIHVPDGFFVVLSGMIRDREARGLTRIPCLGGIPIIGAISKSQVTADDKRNLMLFIRPLIIDTDDDLEDVTKRQQDVYREKSKFRRSWNYEIDEALNFFNIKPTDPDEIGCNQK